MKFAIFTGMGNTSWRDVLSLWKHADQSGWDAACVTDHFMPNTPDRVGDTLECWTALAALAAETKRMRVGTIVSGNTYRHPAVLAKMATNIDIISGGRLICGVGAGWQKNEHTAYGMPFYTMPERLKRLDEACQVLNLLWTQERSTFKGTYYQLDDAPHMPRPVQKPRPELMVGGAARRSPSRSPRAGRITGTCGAVRTSSPRRARSSKRTARRSVVIPRPSSARPSWSPVSRTTPRRWTVSSRRS